MKFSEFEEIMKKQGIESLAEIARKLSTTPQAVSNWKARDQVPYHVVSSININRDLPHNSELPINLNEPNDQFYFSDLLILLAEQLKIIVLTIFIFVFSTFTYVQFIQTPKYDSWATILLPESNLGNLGGLAGLASQFGVSVPTESIADLSSPSLYPEIISSRTFAEKLLDKEFFVNKYNKKLPLINILIDDDTPINQISDISSIKSDAIGILNAKYLRFDQNMESKFSIVKVTAYEAKLAKELADVVLEELDSLNRYFKSKTVTEKISFILSRIESVENYLEQSEKKLKDFNEQNRQISSPSLQLESDRLERDVEIQKEIYLTLKQQLELAKIEEIQETSVVRILDYPSIPTEPSNKKTIISTILAGIIGIALGISFGFVRSYFDNENISERKKIRRVKHYSKKKSKEIMLDYRVMGAVSLIMLAGLPFYITGESQNPVFFGKYSATLLLINILYVLFLLISTRLFIKSIKHKYK